MIGYEGCNAIRKVKRALTKITPGRAITRRNHYKKSRISLGKIKIVRKRRRFGYRVS